MIKNIGITGAAGHIGATLEEDLADKYNLTLFDIKDMNSIPKSVRADLSLAGEVSGIFNGLDAVIHLAADPSTRATWESVLNNNITATCNVFSEGRRAGVRKIVFASTNHVMHGWAALRFVPELIKALTDHFRVMFISRRDLSDAFDKALQANTPS